MKLKSYIYSFIASAVILFSACTPEDHDLGAKTYVSDDLVQGIAFKVTPDAEDPNTIHLQSLITEGVTPLWETPQGRSQDATMTIELPFAGDYEVTFGVMTQAGPVYGPAYKFTVSSNNFNMLSNEIWSNLAGGVGKTRKWIPMDGNYGIGKCTGPVMYMSPTDVKNDGSNISDLVFGGDNWSPNWDPGFQSWLIPADDPYMSSYMTFGLDAANGCTAEVFRNDASGGTRMNGKFNLNLSDPKRPTITFDGCYSLHNAAFDEVCDNYTINLKIIELTPYLLQIATMRTNSEGPWWLVWNFISEEAQQDPSLIPTDDPGLLPTVPVQEPEYANLSESLFTIAGPNATYIATATTFLLNEDAPYDWMWWNGATGAWESNGFEGAGDYTANWTPAFADAGDFSMNLSTTGTAGTYSCELETVDGGTATTFTIVGNKLVFADEISLLTASNDFTTVDIRGKEFTVMACSPDDSQVVLGIPAGTDGAGTVNRYLCANLTIKPITSESGPTVIAVNNEKLNCYVEASKFFRIEMYNPWGDKDWPIDISKVKLRKEQKLTVKFNVNGITWNDGADPKAAICHNIGDGLWEPACFTDAAAVSLNKSGETTVTFTNTTGATANFATAPSCLTIAVQIDGLVSAPLLDGVLDPSAVTVEVTSMTIE
ncbi:hypothetical protein [Bacteroides sp. 51]|uniref:hypothetical protein n=1 Tax=Bacteroides sp. 51 TaxID=2302938 RepID=UPI0013D31D15|nr:hypothetical protein [Bacteroides sp. 51]NDV83789.1 hypothetical protein [Bacteroides sp. 51]